MNNRLYSPFYRLFIVIGLLTALVACGGGGDGDVFSDDPLAEADPTPTPVVEATPEPTVDPTPDPNPEPTPDPTATPAPTATPQPTATPNPTPTPEPEVPTLAMVQEQIFDAHCVLCHASGREAASTGLLLSSATESFNNLVGVISSRAPGEVRVIAGDPDNSYIVKKLEDAPGIVGSRMPLARAALNDNLITLIRDWIAGGALQDATVTSSTKVFGTQVEKVSQGTHYKIQLSREIDPASVTEQAVLVYLHIGEEKVLAEPADLNVTLSGSVLDVLYSGELSQVDGVEVQLNSPLSASVLDATGRIIDGDGDGVDGGVYQYFDLR